LSGYGEFLWRSQSSDQGIDMDPKAAVLQVLLVSMFTAWGSVSARGADINGIWVSDTSVCSKAFEKSGGRVSFSKDAGIYVSGFIIDGNRIQGKIANCTINVRKQQGPVVNLIAVCSTDIAIDTIHFRLRMDGPNKIIREFPGLPGLEMSYERCSL
jgi:hypothetical protein